MRFLRQCIVVLFLTALASVPLAQAQSLSARDAAHRDPRRVLTPGTEAISFYGNFSYSVGSGLAVLKADNVSNTNASATGPLRFSLYWTPNAPYPTTPSYNTAQYLITSSLAAGATLTNVNSGQVPFTDPGNGCYYVALVLEEQVGGVWQMRDYGNLSARISSGQGCLFSFTAAPTTINPGGSSTLSWSTGGTSVTIDNGIGTKSATGSMGVSPSATTSYKLTVNGTADYTPRTATVTVTVATPAPAISSIVPNHGPAAGGNSVTINGTNLTGATSVTFGGTPASLGANNGTSLVVTAPAHAAGSVNVVLTTSGGTATTSYTYDAPATNPPTISSIDPATGPTAGGQVVTITGTNFGSGNTVTFDGLSAAIMTGTSTTIIARTPAHAAGNVNVVVTMPAGTAKTSYTYGDGPQTRIVSVVGSTAGSFGSFFRTAMQLRNNGSAVATGQLIFHPQGTTATATPPSMTFSLNPGQTQAIDDLIAALSSSGVGTLDISGTSLDSLLITSRIYNDAGAAGTTGMGIDPVTPADALQAGDSGVLLAPMDLSAFRFNIGIRSLDAGATVTITLYDANGNVRNTITRSYNPGSFQQTSAADFVGVAPGANETIVIGITSGSAIIYGSITDNITQDPTYEAAKSVAATHARAGAAKLVIPVVGSTAGSFGSFFRTSLQLHNGSASATLTGTLTFHPQGAPASANDPSTTFSLTPGQTKSMSDIVATMNASGVGSLDVTASDLGSLFATARIYNDAGAKGTTGMGLDPLAASDALQPGDTGVLLAPAHTDVFRYNIGVRTLDAGASLLFTVVDSNGNTKHTMSRDFAPNFLQQFGAADLLGTTIANDDAVLITVNSGSAIIYGSITDNRTQDPTYATARRR